MGWIAVVLGSGVAALLFVAIAWRARRWRRAGDHPHCRRCDFDLFGSPAASTRCPECGADLAAPGARVVGQARPDRAAQVWAGVLAAGCVAVALWAARYADWEAGRVRVWPSAWLAAEVERGGAGYPVADELDRRIQRGWLAGDGRERAIRAIWTIRVTPRRSVRAGDAMPYQEIIASAPTLPMGRWEQGDAAPFRVYYRLARFRFVGGAWQSFDGSWQRSAVLTISNTGSSLAVPVDLPAGEGEAEFVYELRLAHRDDVPTRGEDGSKVRHEVYGRDGPRARVAWEQSIRVPIKVLPRGAEGDITTTFDPALRDAVRASVWPAARDGRPEGITLSRDEDGDVNPGLLYVDRPPVPAAFDVWLRDPASGREAMLGRVSGRPGGRRGFWLGESPTLRDWPKSRATLEFRPSPEAARATPTITTIWGEPVIFDDVPIRRSWIADEAATTRPR